jgi:Alpha-L-arabinofuranosidase B, catalytic
MYEGPPIGFISMLTGLGTPGSVIGYTGACDTITVGCKAAYSVTHSLVASYSGNLFELIKQAPAAVVTGSVASGTLTVSGVTSGTLAIGQAVSALGSGTTPAFKPVTYITAGSGTSWTLSDNSVTIGAGTTISAYSILDVGQSSHVTNLSTVPGFCESAICLIEKVFNEASTGSANDLIASNISGGNTYNPNCTASIVACAPLYWIDATVNTPVVPASYPTGLETCAGAVPCTTSGLPNGNATKSVLMVARSDMYTICCGEFGLMEQVGIGSPSGSMFALFANLYGAVFGCTVSSEWCGGVDTEGFSYLANYDTGASQRSVYEIRWDSSTHLLPYLVNNVTVSLDGAPTSNNAGSYVRAGLAGDRSTAPIYLYDGLIAADDGDHTAAYNNLVSWYAARSPSPLAGPLDVAFYVNVGAVGASNGYQSALIGNAWTAYSGRCLTVSYTGPVADLTDSESTPVTRTYGCINGAIDPGAATFCAANTPCRVSGLYVQAPWSADGGNQSNLFDPLLKLGCSGGLSTCPTMSFSGSANALNNEPTMHFSGGQCLLSGTMSGYVSHVLAAFEFGAVMRRTSGTTYGAGIEWGANSYYFVGAGNSANTAAFTNGQAVGSGTSSDNHWHSIIADSTAGSSGTLYVDGVSVGTASTNAGETLQTYVTVGCGWNGSSIINALNGDIAEVWLMPRTSDAAGTLISRVSTIFANDKAFWGPLPN